MTRCHSGFMVFVPTDIVYVLAYADHRTPLTCRAYVWACMSGADHMCGDRRDHASRAQCGPTDRARWLFLAWLTRLLREPHQLMQDLRTELLTRGPDPQQLS